MVPQQIQGAMPDGGLSGSLDIVMMEQVFGREERRNVYHTMVR